MTEMQQMGLDVIQHALELLSGWSCTGGSPTTRDVCTVICGDGKVIYNENL